MIRRTCTLAIVLTLAIPAAAYARVEQCRHIGARAERDACYKRQDEARLAAQKAADAKPKSSATNPEKQIRLENDRVSSKLNGICRNC